MGVVTGVFTYANGSPVANAPYQWKLSGDAIEFTGTSACIAPPIISGYTDANGNLTTTFAFNDALSTSAGLSTYYQLSVKAQNGGQVWNEYYFLTGTAANLNIIPPAGIPVVVTTPLSNILLQTNSVTNADQVKLNQLNGPGVSIAADGAGGVTFAANLVAGTNITLATSTANAITITSTATAGGTTFSTAGQSGFWGPGVTLGLLATGLATNNGQSTFPVANNIYVFQFDLLANYVVSRITVGYNCATTAVANAQFATSIWNAAINSKLLDSGPMSLSFTGAGLTGVTAATVAAVTLTAGTYVLANTANTTLIGLFGQNFSGGSEKVYNAIANTNGTRWGLAASTSSGAVFPASLGVISTTGLTPTMTALCALTFFEP
jgi:hypothetical protein